MTVSELLFGGGVGGVEAEAEVDELGMRRRDSPVEVIAFQILESMAGWMWNVFAFVYQWPPRELYRDCA
jgi:hypothetical protein